MSRSTTNVPARTFTGDEPRIADETVDSPSNTVEAPLNTVESPSSGDMIVCDATERHGSSLPAARNAACRLATLPMRHQAGRFMLGFLLMLVAIDRLVATIELPPVDGTINTPRAKLQLYDKAVSPPDAVYLGISYTLFGVRPDTINPLTSSALNRNVHTLNLAAEGHTLLAQSLMALALIDRHENNTSPLPKVVYFGISPGAADASQTSALRRSIQSLGSAAGTWLATTSPPELRSPAFASSLSASFHRWHDTRLIVRRLVTGTPLTSTGRAAYDQYGWKRWNGGTQRHRLAQQPATSPETPNPAFDIENVNGRALCIAIAQLKQAGINVCLLELPVSSTAPPHKQRHGNAPYLAFLDDIQHETGVRVTRPPNDLLTDDDYFDHGHLLPDGAAKLSRWLATDLINRLEV